MDVEMPGVSGSEATRAIRAADRALEEVELLRAPVINPLELEAGADGPVHRERADAEDFF